MSDIDPTDRVLALARKGMVTTRQFVAAGIHRQILTRMVEARRLERVSRGVYALPDHALTESHDLALVSAAVPEGVVCLISALTFHGIGTQIPHQVWIALDRRAHRPAQAFPPLRVVRFTGAALCEGIEERSIEGQTVRIYGPAKTVADCFKYRNKIGLDVALEALREGWLERKFTMSQIDQFAAICRVRHVMRPYLESLLA